MIRDPAHGRPLLLAAVLPCQCDFQFPGRCQGILKKHFIKVSKTVKEDTVRILLFGFHVLLHHRR